MVWTSGLRKQMPLHEPEEVSSAVTLWRLHEQGEGRDGTKDGDFLDHRVLTEGRHVYTHRFTVYINYIYCKPC